MSKEACITKTPTAPNQTTAKRLVAHMRDGIAVIRVGPESISYYIHKALLVKHSEYFNRALNGNWKEAEEGTVTLQDVDCDTFEIFVEWMYSQTLPTLLSGWVKDLPSGLFNQHKAVQMAMAKACVFANRFLAKEFGKAVSCVLVNRMAKKASPYYEVIAYAYESLPEESPILTVLIDSHCKHFSTNIDDEENGEIYQRDILPRRFLLGVMLRLTKIKENGLKGDLDPCDYHDHVSPAEKEACDVAANVTAFKRWTRIR